MELTDHEKTTLEIFTSEAGAYEVVYKIAKERIEKARDTFTRSLSVLKDKSNEEIGAKLRAFDEGMLLVDSIFREIGQYRKQNIKPKVNHAR
jgi:hypothetical protein